MQRHKGKIITGTILTLISPIVLVGAYHFGIKACHETVYFLCNVTPLGIRYVPIYLAGAVALVGMALILYAVVKKNK